MARILVVEDDRDLNNAYCVILRNEGHEVATAHDGKQALSQLQKFTPDLILLDLLMPVMGGLEFLQHYDLLHDHRGVKVLIFTNMENSPEVEEAYKLGADRCIIKSWTAPHNLAKVVSDSLNSDDSENLPPSKSKKDKKTKGRAKTKAKA
ncbi:MAG TPA: response regulator [Candidatus Saccharimonadales bacterium]|nr:response regulator [Candidatus Saccharimonadales bacterium]